MTLDTATHGVTTPAPRARPLIAASIALTIGFNAAIFMPYFVGHRYFWVLTAVLVAVSVGIGVAFGQWGYRSRVAQQQILFVPESDERIELVQPMARPGEYALVRKRGEYTLSSLELSTEDAPLRLHHYDNRITAGTTIRLLRHAHDIWSGLYAVTDDGVLAHAQWQASEGGPKPRVWVIRTAHGNIELRGAGLLKTFGLFDDDRRLVTLVGRWGPTCTMTVHEPVPAWLLLLAAHCLFVQTPW